MGDTLGVRVSRQTRESLRDLANLYYKLGLIPYPRVGLLIETFGVKLLKGYLEKYIKELEKERGLR
jgi:hypothetical protein